MIKKIEIFISGEEAYNLDTLRAIHRKDFRVEIEFPKPTEIRVRQDPASGRVDHSGRGFVVGYQPSPEPPTVYLIIGEEGDRLYKAARALLDYAQEVGPYEYTARFGSLDVLEVCKEIVEEGEGNPHPWRDRRK